MTIFFMVLLAFALDKLFSEPKRFHPLVYFGQYVEFIEQRYNIKNATRVQGIIGYLLAVLPVLCIAMLLDVFLKNWSILHFIFSVGFLYIAVGWKSLVDHASAISAPLAQGDIAKAQQALSMIVSRDTQELTERDISKAATESVLENGADAVFSAVFWFVLFGVPGVILYRCSNTLDAMWGYKTERFLNFGWCAARVDDVLNLVPAQLTALSYALMGNFSRSVHYWRRQGFNWKSPNAGPVMAAGAGALNVSLGGSARYHNQQQHRPILGPIETAATAANAQSINRACDLVNKTVLLWLTAIMVVGLA